MLKLNLTPFPTLETERCLLRGMQKEDAPEILHLRSHSATMQYLDRDKMKAVEEAEALIQKMNDDLDNNEAISWGIQLKEEDKLIGYIGYWRIMKEHYRAEIGYMLHPHYWNKGIMNEVMKKVIPFAFDHLKLHSIEANVNPNNAASIKILEKNGFVREGYFKENYYYNGRFLDSAIYSLIEPDNL